MDDVLALRTLQLVGSSRLPQWGMVWPGGGGPESPTLGKCLSGAERADDWLPVQCSGEGVAGDPG